ncbi:MAG: TonB-dependent receptor [Mucilaginibacter sp.]|nr:TonB-dependent receptor [Mucilaginibacter sp.]
MNRKLTKINRWLIAPYLCTLLFTGIAVSEVKANAAGLNSWHAKTGLGYSAADIVVLGTVKDKQGPLPGVTVELIGNNKIVTSTDNKGNFSIKVPQNGTLLFRSVGYRSIKIPVNGNRSLEITLEEDNTSLNEVTVVGYGSQKKSDLTGSISSIKSQDIALLPTQRVDQAIQGRAAGVLVLNTDGSPGGNTTIRIRGMNSINGGNNALIVIDGLQGGNLTSLNPNDIESVEILKDASATAIYGSQGANGVVLITTKQGKIGKPIIRYTFDGSFASIAKRPDLLNAADYARETNAVALAKNGSGINPLPIFSDAQIQDFQKNGGTNWLNVIYRTAFTQNHQLSVSGASEKVNYLVSGGYLDQQGILLNSQYKRFSLRTNIKADMTSWAAFGLNWAASKENASSPPFGGSTDWPNNPVGAAARFSPTIPVYDANGNYSKSSLFYGNPTLWNPLASAVEPQIDNGTITNNLSAYLEFKLLTGLTLRISGGARIATQQDLSYLNLNTFTGAQLNGSGAILDNQSEYYQNSNILTYDKTFKKHHLNLTAVAEQKYDKLFSSSINASDFLVQQTAINDLSGAGIKTIGSSFNDRVVNSYLGRINYSYADKYLLTASYRADGSSVFGKNNKWGYFPSASLAWRAVQENFIKDLNIFSDLKIRASWGITGNQGINPYQTLARTSSGVLYPYDGSDAANVGFYLSSAANPNLKWESTAQTDIGLDAGFFNGRLSVTADYYKKTTTNLLMPRQLPTYTGLGSILDNVGSMGNKGIELAIEGTPLVGKFQWNAGFNISANKTTVLDLGGIDKIGYISGGSGSGTNLPFMYLVKGQDFGQMLGWGYQGVWKTSQAAQAARYGQLPGDPHYTDVNNDGKININDMKVIGNSLPKFIFGFNNRLGYKNFEFIFLIQGVQGNNIFNVSRIALESPGGTSAGLLNRWTPQNQNSSIPAIIDQRTREQANLVSTISLPSTGNNRISRWIEDGSYVRLKNVTLAYNFPKILTDKIKLHNLKVYVSATNLLTITKYSGNDPEVSSYTGNDAQLGSDFNNYPQSKIFNIGLNTSF